MTTHRSAAAATTPAAAAPALADLAGLPVHGISLEHSDTVAAEHWLASLSPAPVLAFTHLVRMPRPHVALSLVFAGTTPDFAGTAPTDLGNAPSGLGAAPMGLSSECAEAVAEHRARSSGRAVLYPGVELLVGTLSVAEVLELSAIEKVEILGGGPADPATLIDTGDFVRPQWRSGVLTLITTPAAGGRLVPFETRHPTPCCAAH
ncbi:hypothetical protein [Actinoplanes auranticolor]|uniref:Uncharacterized protein n=1 Tax=Actinoplanes auranticolor TaxID=47988 RepID=A0A919VKX0_9ACTN|nr:hypothetical protein [Actinoplanes auranticolor]GIM69984.1 hypothetical protein Aau02nite_38870 [Actinoplanes auranticolor]